MRCCFPEAKLPRRYTDVCAPKATFFKSVYEAETSLVNFKIALVVLREPWARLRLAPKRIITVFPAAVARQDDDFFDA